MLHYLAVIVIGSTITALASAPGTTPATPVLPSLASTPGTTQPAQAQDPDVKAPGLPPLPPRPKGKSTVMGGIIRSVDTVRDQLTLRVYGNGGRPIKILFDERTKVFKDGAKINLRDLRPDDHATVETVLDGTTVFAVTIHMLTKQPEGDSQGKVLDFNPGTGDLTLSDSLSQEPIKLRVSPGTPVVRQGQAGRPSGGGDQGAPGTLSDIAKGTLIGVTFAADNNGRGNVSHVSILATPGSSFLFSGSVTFLDLHAKTLTINDSRDDKNYKIAFDPDRFPVSKDLKVGAPVNVNATYDGTNYTATDITSH